MDYTDDAQHVISKLVKTAEESSKNHSKSDTPNYAYVAGYMGSAFVGLLRDLKLSKKQLKLLSTFE